MKAHAHPSARQFLAGVRAIQPRHRQCVATLGSFDGVHLGHQAIIEKLVHKAQQSQCPSCVILFEPQPMEFFNPQGAPTRLMRLRNKLDALFALGVDQVLCLRFNTELRQQTADMFVRDILVNRLAIKHLEIGDDFRFGCDRAGDFNLLQTLGRQLGFTVENSATLSADHERVSSTRIRQLLQSGQLHSVQTLLGNPYAISGKVIYGRQLGRQWNLPTLNIALGLQRSPLQGVYAVRVRLPGAQLMQFGVANVGCKPSVEQRIQPLLEVHVLDFNQNLYGQCVTIEFCHKLRDEQKFDELDQLIKQIHQDILNAREYFAKHKII